MFGHLDEFLEAENVSASSHIFVNENILLQVSNFELFNKNPEQLGDAQVLIWMSGEGFK